MANSAFFVRHGLSANGQTTISSSNGQILVGSNLSINTSTISIGNSTVNSFISSSLLQVSNSTAIANIQPLQITLGTVVVNTTIISANGITVNSTGGYITGLINSSSFTVGSSTIANSTGVYTGVVNAASHTVGTSTIANSTGVYTGVVNAASHTVGSSTIANSTGVYTGVVNCSSITISTQLDVTGTVTTAKANVVSQTLTDGTTISWDTSLGQIATVTLGGNRTLAAPTNLKIGTYILHVIQDGTGSRTLTWNSVFKWPAGVAPVLTTTASARDIISFVSDGTNLYGTYIPDVK
jgi:hypothetical protein